MFILKNKQKQNFKTLSQENNSKSLYINKLKLKPQTSHMKQPTSVHPKKKKKKHPTRTYEFSQKKSEHMKSALDATKFGGSITLKGVALNQGFKYWN